MLVVIAYFDIGQETLMTHPDYWYPRYAKLLHLGMAGFGIAAFLSGELAEDGPDTFGFLLHTYLGLSLATFILLRVLRGIVGGAPLQFAGWSPFSRRQWRLAIEDLRSLVRFQVPERGMHEGLAGLTQAFGIALFTWMGATGTGLFLLGGGPEGDLFEMVEEVHEIGEALIPLYLTLHVGSVVLHSLSGHPIWQRMWTFRRHNKRLQQADNLR